MTTTNVISFVIRGQTYSLKNTRDIFPIKADKGCKCPYCYRPLRMITVPNDKAKLFEKDFKQQLPPSAVQRIEAPVYVEMTIYYPTNLQDLDEALVLDLLQRYDVIANDRQVVDKRIRKRIDRDHPRVVIRVEPVVWDRTGDQPELFETQKPEGALA